MGSLQEVVMESVDILAIAETKIDESFLFLLKLSCLWNWTIYQFRLLLVSPKGRMSTLECQQWSIIAHIDVINHLKVV